MGDHSKATPMRPLRDVLRDVEAMIDVDEEDLSADGPCLRCNGTGTEVIQDEQTGITSAKRCSH
jgi:hypothetical protein